MRALMLTALALAGCAPTVAEIREADGRAAKQEAKIAQALAGLNPGTAQDCLSGIDRRSAQVQSHGSSVLFRVNRDLVYRNDMNGGCGSGGNDPIFVTQTPTASLCRGDIVQLIDRGSRAPVGSCSYGTFVPYRRVK